MGNMRFKVGDRVKIKSIDWYNENNDTSGILSYKISGVPFTPEMAKYCGCIVTIDKVIVDANSILGDRYRIKEDDGTWVWHEKMFEGLAEEDNPFDDNIPLPDSFVERMVHKISDSELFNVEPLDIPTMTTDFVKEHGLPCPDGYEFRDENGNVINATKIVLEKKKKEYPKTYEEFVSLVRKMREAQKKIKGYSSLQYEDDRCQWEHDLHNKMYLESEVDEYLKKMEV